ncbi:MAG: condensation domain-containing protein [Planctomycetota bacterium]
MSPAKPNGPARTPGGLSAKKRELLARMLEKKGLKPAREQGIPRRPAGSGRVPLSSAQEALWFLDQLEPETESGRALHNQPGAVRLAGTLDVEALRRSLDEIVRRHEALRTRFVTADGKPYQDVVPHEPIELPLTDLSDRPRDEAEAEALRIASEDAHKPFDLERGPLRRMSLLRLAADEHILVITLHHIITDGWSMGVFATELDQLYRAYLAGEPSPLPELPIQMGDVALWQRDALQGEALEGHLAYWRKQLAPPLTGLALPTDRPRPAVQSYRGGHQTILLSAELSDALRALSRKQGVTLFMTLHAAWSVLLHAITNERDVVIGSAVAHRNRKELEGLIGFLVNMLILRLDLSGDPTFPELLRRAREVTVGAWSHQDLPLTRIIKEVAPERDLSRNPLFQIEFSLLTPDKNPAVFGYGLAMGSIETVELPGLIMTPVDVNYDNARYDVAVFLWDMPGGVHGTIEYSTDLFDAATMERLASRYETVLRAVVERPDVTLAGLVDVLTAADRDAAAAAEQSHEQSMKDKLKSIRRRRARPAPPGDGS